jgi:UDP-2-acetamido-2-deoxy-ribo-hexuluronate aminotransferase
MQYVNLQVQHHEYNSEIDMALIALRQKIAERHTSLLKENAISPRIMPERISVWAQHTIWIMNRETVQEKLQAHGITTAVYYPMSLHLQKAFYFYCGKIGDFPGEERAASEVMSLPMSGYLHDAELVLIVESLLSCL